MSDIQSMGELTAVVTINVQLDCILFEFFGELPALPLFIHLTYRSRSGR
ncbi:MAG: hypothetical protein KAH23_04070 [Kiritimatiellae bacterium]|nr:hypothetical protein [Kiritimatiellia bacterium]